MFNMLFYQLFYSDFIFILIRFPDFLVLRIGQSKALSGLVIHRGNPHPDPFPQHLEDIQEDFISGGSDENLMEAHVGPSEGFAVSYLDGDIHLLDEICQGVHFRFRQMRDC